MYNQQQHPEQEHEHFSHADVRNNYMNPYGSMHQGGMMNNPHHLRDFCRKHKYHYVIMEMNDGRRYDGIIMDMDEGNVHLLMPVGEELQDVQGDLDGNRQFGFGFGRFPFRFRRFHPFFFPFFGIRRFFFPFFF